MIKPVVIALIKKGNKYLMTKRISFDPKDKEFYPFVWQFPGGGMEFGETPEEAAKREMVEEIGTEIEIVNVDDEFAELLSVDLTVNEYDIA